jgi:hypothetical protein
VPYGDNDVTTVLPRSDALRPKRRWFQYSLRTLLLVVILASIGMSWFAVRMKRARQQQEAVKAIVRLGGKVEYDYETTYEYPDACMDGQSLGCSGGPRPKSSVPAWLNSLLGEDFFAAVITVELDSARMDSNDALEQVRHLPRLQQLVTGGNSELTEEGQKCIEGLTHLRCLGIPSSVEPEVRLDHLQALERLEFLELGGPTDENLRQIAGFRQLRGLRIGSCEFTDSGLQHIGKLVGLRDLILNCNGGMEPKITDHGLQYLRGLPHLERLSLFNTRITDAGLAHLSALSQLRELDLSCTDITDAGLQSLRMLTQLEKLDLGSTNVSNAGLKRLNGLDQLDGLTLHGTRVTDDGLPELKKLTRLKWLTVPDEMTDKGIKSLQQALPACNVGR